VTTVMFRNIPGRYTQRSLLQEIQQEGFQPDYFYLPMDFKKNANAGYAFLNFGSEAEVLAFRARYEGARLVIRSAKILQVVPAALQGYDANFAHMQHSAVLNHHRPEHGPLFMREAREEAKQTETGLFCVRDLPQLYTHELMALELLQHGCGADVAFLDVPLNSEGLSMGYALVRFADAGATARCVAALQGARFSLAPAALPMSITAVGAQEKARAFEYTASVAQDAAQEEYASEGSQELAQMLAELAELQRQVFVPLGKEGRFSGLGIAVDEAEAKPRCATPPTRSTHCSDSSPRIVVDEDRTPSKARVTAVTPPTRSASCSSGPSSAGSSPRGLPAAEWVPGAPFALPCLLPSPSSCRAIAQGC